MQAHDQTGGSPSTSLLSRLQGAVDSVKEKARNRRQEKLEGDITENVRLFLQQESILHCTPIELLYARIGLANDTLEGCIVAHGKQVRSVSLEELVKFLSGNAALLIPGIRRRIRSSVSFFMVEWCASESLESEKINFHIAYRANQVVVEAFLNRVYIKDVAVEDLINYFTA